MRTEILENILNKKQLKKVTAIVNSNNKEDVLSELKLYFKEMEEELSEKGVYHEYLAWSIYAILNKEI
jgi:CHASE3 domain sensor protein